mmetsp:Transcript_3983/g.9571  ORF Transcript_3983/g.9571 Transcript_3983/m.9571 type:complete len:114 (+) Transcript_3983:1208-1549(+)
MGCLIEQCYPTGLSSFSNPSGGKLELPPPTEKLQSDWDLARDSTRLVEGEMMRSYSSELLASAWDATKRLMSEYEIIRNSAGEDGLLGRARALVAKKRRESTTRAAESYSTVR